MHTPVVRDEKTTAPAVADAATVNGEEPNRLEEISLKATGLVAAVYVIDVATDSVPDALPRTTCTFRDPSVAPLIRLGAVKTMLVEVTELVVTEAPPILSKVSEDIPVVKLAPVSVTVCDPVLVTDVGLSEIIIGTAT